jgi:hypothetical protein
MGIQCRLSAFHFISAIGHRHGQICVVDRNDCGLRTNAFNNGLSIADVGEAVDVTGVIEAECLGLIGQVLAKVAMQSAPGSFAQATVSSLEALSI